MKKFVFFLSIFSIIYSCSKTETSSSTPPVVTKLSGCDSVRLGLLKSTKDLLRLGCNSVTIGTQKWMTVNLDIETYRNGDIIPQVTDPTVWGALRTGAWCYYDNNVANGAKYGKLYNWYAVNDSRGLAPVGWHIPSNAEWETLNTFLGYAAGGKLKEVGFLNWQSSPGYNATNVSGFTALPGGLLGFFNGGEQFINIGREGYWWSATEYYVINTTGAWYRTMTFNSDQLGIGLNSKTRGLSVRILRD